MKEVMVWVEQTVGAAWRVRHADGEGPIRSVSGFAGEKQARD